MIPNIGIRAGTQAQPRRKVSYWCLNGHQTLRSWSAAVAAPELWDCQHCGLPAGQDHAEFARRYRIELDDPERAEQLHHLRELSRQQPLTLLTATRHVDISEAAVLAGLLAPESGTG